ncbi:hypothetical protein OG210_32525 [Streptomyces sp. NBC_00466]|uniref:hypothetical protein n=1 Tax=Streptomyces sp. NBC_00466 TaxID=2903655 RepID=UPI003255A41A
MPSGSAIRSAAAPPPMGGKGIVARMASASSASTVARDHWEGGGVDLLCIGELGSMELDRRGRTARRIRRRRPRWERLCQLWMAHADGLRRELGGDQVQSLLGEAHTMLPTLAGRRAVLLTLRRPAGTPEVPGAADRMTGPHGNPYDRPVSDERISQ